MEIGIEAINAYSASTFISVREIFKGRGLNLDRFNNLMMKRKSVGLPCEDAVTFGVNAVKPIIDQMSNEEKSRIEMVITSSESGIDFGKSISTYIHDYLSLDRSCRLFEVKQACYGGTAALQMALGYIASNVSPGAKVLVVATDVARAAVKGSYAEPSQGEGAVAMLVSDKPEILEVDLGANGMYSFEVMDTCRPLPDIEAGDSDLSLFSYLNCLENSYRNYADKLEEINFDTTFDYLAFHTPFAGLIKGAHRQMMRKFSDKKGRQIDEDFQTRVQPSLNYCVEVGNVYSATLYLSLCSLIDNVEHQGAGRVGLFSYGSGCSSEFYSGVVSDHSQSVLSKMNIRQHLDNRHELSIEEYDDLMDQNTEWLFGIKDKEVNFSKFSTIYEKQFKGKELLVLKAVDNNYHRKYMWS